MTALSRKWIPLTGLVIFLAAFSANAQTDSTDAAATEQNKSDTAAPAVETQPDQATDDAATQPQPVPTEDTAAAETAAGASEGASTASESEKARTEKNEPSVTVPADARTSQPSAEPATVTHQDVAVKTEPAAAVTDSESDKPKRHMFVVTYNLAKPLGATAEFVNEFSFEGFGFGYRFFLKKQLSIGALFSWSTFEKKESDQFSVDDRTTITGTRIKMIDLIQLAPSIHYYFTPQTAKAVPFVGINMGPYFASHIIDWGWWYQKESTWQFGFTPEAGVRIAGLPIPIYLSVRYSYSFEANTLKAQQYMGINLGIAFLK